MKVEKEYKDIEENLRKWFKQKWVNIGKKKKNLLLEEKERHKTKLVEVVQIQQEVVVKNLSE